MPKKKPAVRNACFQIRIGSPEILLYKAKLSDMIGNKILEDNASMLRFEKCGETHRHPYGENIPSQRSSELFQSITDESRHAGSILYQ
jgi:hypothetical protein